MLNRHIAAAAVSITCVLILMPVRADPTRASIAIELRAHVSAPPFRAKRSDVHPTQNIDSSSLTPDNANPWFDALYVELTGGQSDIDARLLHDLELSDSVVRIPTVVTAASRVITTYAPRRVAAAHELGHQVKTVRFTVKGISHVPVRPGRYRGDLTIVFEPSMPVHNTAPEVIFTS